MPVSEALRIAEAAGLDLVEVNPKVEPPVCKIMDYGRFKYEKSKQAKAAKKHQTTVTVKEIKLRPKTDTHDFNVKVKRINRFLKEGHKVKIQIIFRGREIVHPETGQEMLQRIVDDLGEKLVIYHNATMEGRRMVMTVAPNPEYDFKKEK
jgi:translation initiation factor IF-3